MLDRLVIFFLLWEDQCFFFGFFFFFFFFFQGWNFLKQGITFFYNYCLWVPWSVKKDINTMHFMYLQEAANVFGNFTVKYLNITHGRDLPGVDEFRTESIFRVAVAFEKFALSYGKYHLSGTRRSVRIDLRNMCEYDQKEGLNNGITDQSTKWLNGWDRLTFILTFREIEWLTDLLTDNATWLN